MTEQVLGVFALWIVWEVVSYFIEADVWMWRVGLVVAGVGWEALGDSPLWWGPGVAGGAAFIGLVADALLLIGDAAKVRVLRNTRGS